MLRRFGILGMFIAVLMALSMANALAAGGQANGTGKTHDGAVLVDAVAVLIAIALIADTVGVEIRLIGVRSQRTVVIARPYAWPLDSLLKGGITISVAALSWHFFERPINNLKRYFKYDGGRWPKEVARGA